MDDRACIDGAELGCEMVSDGEEHGEGKEVEVEHGFLPCWWAFHTVCILGGFAVIMIGGGWPTVSGESPVLDEPKKTRKE
jgi:hypothetical protein